MTLTTLKKLVGPNVLDNSIVRNEGFEPDHTIPVEL